MRRCLLSCALAVLASIAAPAAGVAAAIQPPSPLDRVSLWLGGYFSTSDTSLGVRGAGRFAGIGGKLGFEDDLGFRKHTLDPRAHLDFLLGDSQGFSFDYYRIHRDRSVGYEQPIPVLDTDVGARVAGTLDYDFGAASYRWWFGRAGDAFGIGLGAARYELDFTVDAAAHAGDHAASFSGRYREMAWAPMLTLAWRHAFDPHWRMYMDLAGVRKNGGRLSGHSWNAALGVEWFPWQHLGFALEYSAARLHLDRHYHQGVATLDLDSDGPTLYLRARF